MDRYTSILFDADDTLLDFDAAERAAFKMTCEKFGVEYSDGLLSLYSSINLSLWKKFERREIQKSDILKRRFAELFSEAGISGDCAVFGSEYISFLAKCAFKIEGADDICRLLTERGYVLYIITNGSERVQSSRMELCGLKKYFSGIFISEKTGAGKPDKRFFDYVLNNIGEKNKYKILVVGDSPTSDIKGGADSGLDTCYLNKKGEKPERPATFEITKLSELIYIL
ncbi:MAG: YjjG family noncanonical pyrimidine nucleotidase [Clostridiales bacterium]|nr:YjjG family noncanonical pyrimidine nucleotidase [Clostridiales bacterium]